MALVQIAESSTLNKEVGLAADALADAARLEGVSAVAQELGEEVYMQPHIWDALDRARRKIEKGAIDEALTKIVENWDGVSLGTMRQTLAAALLRARAALRLECPCYGSVVGILRCEHLAAVLDDTELVEALSPQGVSNG